MSQANNQSPLVGVAINHDSSDSTSSKRHLNQGGQSDNFQKVKSDKNEKLKGQSLRSSTGFFSKHSYRDAMRHKCHFCLAFCSVFTVVFSMLVINSVIEKGPIIFLQLSEGQRGEIDAQIRPSSSYLNAEDGTKFKVFLNYTRVDELFGKEYNLSPRYITKIAQAKYDPELLEAD
jgi:hypothetical protein